MVDSPAEKPEDQAQTIQLVSTEPTAAELIQQDIPSSGFTIDLGLPAENAGGIPSEPLIIQTSAQIESMEQSLDNMDATKILPAQPDPEPAVAPPLKQPATLVTTTTRPRLRPAATPAAELGKFSDDEHTDMGIVPPKATPSVQSVQPTQIMRKPLPPPPQKSLAEAEEEKTDPAIALPTRPAAAAPPRLNPNIKMPEMGPLTTLMRDPTISEIMVNDLRNVMIEREGQLSFSGFTYPSIDELNRLVRNILDVTGRILSPDSPYVDVTLPDGSRVNIVGPPITNAPCLTIRKFPATRYIADDLIRRGMFDRKIGFFLNACVVSKMNILVSGGTSSGKTTLLNVLAGFIPKNERIVMIEDTAELMIPHANSVRMLTKPQTVTTPAITERDLVANALRMRPDRIIIGESRRAEAFDMLQAMNTGHDGSMTALHANSARDAISRLETLGMMAGVDLPVIAIRKQIVNAIDLIIQIKRHRNGKRRIVAINEVTGMEGEVVTLQDIFLFEHTGIKNVHDGAGVFKATGFVPTFMERFREHGVEIPNDLFS